MPSADRISCDSWKKKISFPPPSCRRPDAKSSGRRPRLTPSAFLSGLCKVNTLPLLRPIGSCRRQPKRWRSPRPCRPRRAWFCQSLLNRTARKVRLKHLVGPCRSTARSARASWNRPDVRAGQAGKPDVPKSPKLQHPAARPIDDLELAPLEEPEKNEPTKPVPAKPGSRPKDPAVPPRVSSPAQRQNKNGPAAAKIGGELESLESTMKGPLDALIESEALGAATFDDPLTGPQLEPAAPKKFKLRRFLKKFFKNSSAATSRRSCGSRPRTPGRSSWC